MDKYKIPSGDDWYEVHKGAIDWRNSNFSPQGYQYLKNSDLDYEVQQVVPLVSRGIGMYKEHDKDYPGLAEYCLKLVKSRYLTKEQSKLIQMRLGLSVYKQHGLPEISDKVGLTRQGVDLAYKKALSKIEHLARNSYRLAFGYDVLYGLNVTRVKRKGKIIKGDKD